MKKYYRFIFWDSKGIGWREVLAESEEEALERIKQYLNRFHPFRKYHIELDSVTRVS